MLGSNVRLEYQASVLGYVVGGKWKAVSVSDPLLFDVVDRGSHTVHTVISLICSFASLMWSDTLSRSHHACFLLFRMHSVHSKGSVHCTCTCGTGGWAH